MSKRIDLPRGHKAEPDETGTNERSWCRICGGAIWRFHGGFAESNPWRHQQRRRSA